MNPVRALVIVAALLLVGCASVTPVATQTKVVDSPPLNTVHEEELGNTLLQYVISNTRPSIRVIEPWGIGSRSKNLAPQVLRPVGVGAKVARYYIEDAPPEMGELFRQVCYDPADRVFFIPNGFGVCDFVGKQLVNSGPVRVEQADYVDVRAPQFSQELIYNGKAGNVVKFLYRELSGGYMRPAFTQEVQYDLAEGNVVGFKGARIEIVSSTNNGIVYKVLSTFRR
ncbi:MAG: hypothetical protein KIT60_06930 [Burkholderiaceae bacterium]|nr:hypothetical protein [Burkholderiaceae bacterium]